MLDTEILSETLELLSDAEMARKRGRQLRPFRGMRGVPPAELTRLIADTWTAEQPQLTRVGDDLHDLFMTAHEDGILAIGLIAARVPDEPNEALALVDRWTDMVDDVETADALGWLVLGPALLAAGRPFADALLGYRHHPREEVRRMAVMACMAALPHPVEGPAAAALRERMNRRDLAFVTEPLGDAVRPVADGYVRDDAPRVRKALSRVLRVWGSAEPDAVEDFIDNVKGGSPKYLRKQAERGIRKGRRAARTGG